jgi:hypothetical protein
MEYLEYMLAETKKAEALMDDLYTVLRQLVDAPRRGIRNDLARVLPTESEVGGAFGVIEYSRGSASTCYTDLRTELETLHAALDDAIGAAGRLV